MTTRKLLPINQVMRAFKEAKGVDADDANWDKKFYSRFIRPAKELLKIFDDNHMRTIGYILTEGSRLDESGLDWGFEAIIRAAGRDYSKLFGGNNGLAESKVESTRLDARGRNRELASPREIVSDALRTLKASGVRPEGSRDMGGTGEDLIGDNETFS